MNLIALEADLTVAGIVRQKSWLDAALADSHAVGAIELDLLRVSAFDGAGLQLLLSFWHAAAESGRDVVLHNTPRSIAAVLEEYDVADRFKTGAGKPITEGV